MGGTRLTITADAAVSCTTGGTEYGLWRVKPAANKSFSLRSLRLWCTAPVSTDGIAIVRVARVLDANVGATWTDVTSTTCKVADATANATAAVTVYKGATNVGIAGISTFDNPGLIYDGMPFPTKLPTQLGEWRIGTGDNLIILVNHATSARSFLCHMEIDQT